MNKDNLQQIFIHYINRFDYINNETHNENYKWKVAKKFRKLMDEALSKDGMEFADALYEVKKSTFNIIDSYTQPFHGLVEYARKEPDNVKQMFLSLYSDDKGDLYNQQKLIEEFFDRSHALLNKYYPESYRYKQNSHSVSAYLFLYDPDHHYMFKATHASSFADAVEFYDDWGSGDNIKLQVFYRMCDELVEEIKNCDILLSTNACRFEDRFRDKSEDLFEDAEKHMLAFDIIYCCSTYDLFDGIKYGHPNSKEKKILIEKKRIVTDLQAEYSEYSRERKLLEEARNYYIITFGVGENLIHKKFGLGTVESINRSQISVFFSDCNETKKLGFDISIVNGIISSDRNDFAEKSEKYIPIMKKSKLIEGALAKIGNTLKEYEEVLD